MAQSDWNIFGAGTWTIVTTPVVSGSYAILLDSLASGNSIVLLYNGDTNIGNTEIKAWFQAQSAAPGRPALFWRQQSLSDVDNGYAMQVVTDHVYVYRVVTGTWTLLATASVPNIAGSYQQYRVRMKGYDIEVCRWNGSDWDLLLVCPDPAEAFASGAAGFGNWYQGRSYFDDVCIGEETP